MSGIVYLARVLDLFVLILFSMIDLDSSEFCVCGEGYPPKERFRSDYSFSLTSGNVSFGLRSILQHGSFPSEVIWPLQIRRVTYMTSREQMLLGRTTSSSAIQQRLSKWVFPGRMTRIGTVVWNMQFEDTNTRSITFCIWFATVLSRRKNNCHDFAACALNEMELPGYKNYTFNCNNLALLAFTKGHFLSFGAFCVSWLPFITIVAIIIGLLFICKCLIENSLLFLVSLKFRTFLELMTSLFTLWTDMFVWTVFSPVTDLKAVSTQNCITAVLCKMSMSERRSNPTLPLHNDDTWPHWDNS